MTQITQQQQQQLQASAGSVVAKLERFGQGLSADERFVLGAALSTAAAADDVAGYDYAIDRAAKAYVDSLPIWGPLQQAIKELTRPINWPK